MDIISSEKRTVKLIDMLLPGNISLLTCEKKGEIYLATDKVVTPENSPYFYDLFRLSSPINAIVSHQNKEYNMHVLSSRDGLYVGFRDSPYEFISGWKSHFLLTLEDERKYRKIPAVDPDRFSMAQFLGLEPIVDNYYFEIEKAKIIEKD